MRTVAIALVAVFVVGSATAAAAQTVVTYYPAAAPVTTYYAPGAPVAAYYAPAPAYYAPAPVTTYYAPVVTTRYYAPRYIVRPKVYVRGQPIRNVLRAITP